jgi:membrane protein
VAFVFWVYFSGVVLMIGAIVASLREHRHVTAGQLPGTNPPAEWRALTKDPLTEDALTEDAGDGAAVDAPPSSSRRGTSPDEPESFSSSSAP